MRMMSLFITFLVALYYFYPKAENTGPTIDAIKLKMSAQRKAAPVERPKAIARVVEETKVAEVVEQEESYDQEPTTHEEDTAAVAENAESIPWEEIEKGWENEVKETLVRLEPEDGEAMYSAYLNERENHKNEIDALFSEGREPKSRAPSMVEEGTDEAIGALDQKHEDRLKEILGLHYDEINKRHQEYLESIQHLNRDGLDGDIGVSL